MATLDLSATSRIPGRAETQHAASAPNGTYLLVTTPARFKLASVAVRGNDGSLLWALGVAEGGTPAAGVPQVSQGIDDQVWERPVQAMDFSMAESTLSFGIAGDGAAVDATVFLRWA